MHTFVTTACATHGHREVTLQTEHPPLVPQLERLLLDYFENAVAGGTTFAPGYIVRAGWAVLRLCERDDGTLGVQERELQPGPPAWREQVDRALTDTWMQREVVASVGLMERIAFPMQDQLIVVHDCALTTIALQLQRAPDEGLPSAASGWRLRCAGDHDHGKPTAVPLLAIAAKQPSLVQLLALPHGTSATVTFRATADGKARITPHIYDGARELAPVPGSYIAALQASSG